MAAAYANCVLDELQRKTAELQALLRALPDLFFRFDAEGRFLDFSAPSSAHLYTSPDNFLGKRPSEVMPPELASAMDRVRRETLASGALVTHEYELPLGGTLQHFEARYVPFLDGQTIAIVRNITERRHAELALRASEARLRESQKIEAVGRLAGGVAHDFNNLLMIIASHSSLIAQQTGPDHPIAPALEEIIKAGQRASALTKQLLALSRRQPTQRTSLDLGEVLDEVHSMLRRVIGDSIVLETRVAADLEHICADRAQVEQVVLNLVLNGRDAMPEGGALTISASNVAADAGGPCPYVELSVADTGLGMSPETRERMFEPFFTTKEHGTGLGLFTVQQIVRESGGSVTAESEVGRGTRIRVLWPTAKRQMSERQASEVALVERQTSEVALVERQTSEVALVERSALERSADAERSMLPERPLDERPPAPLRAAGKSLAPA